MLNSVNRKIRKAGLSPTINLHTSEWGLSSSLRNLGCEMTPKISLIVKLVTRNLLVVKLVTSQSVFGFNHFC